jgi:ribosome-associated toxin RatA of RatAB toxin-antitoxin module
MSDFEHVEAPKRSKKGLYVGGVIIAVFVGLLTWAWVRGTVADTVPLPAGPKAVSQLLIVDGVKIVRAVRIVPASPDVVWAAITDYSRFKDTFPFLRQVDVKTEADGKILFHADVDAHVENIDYSVRIEHTKEGEMHVSRWEGAGGRFAVNRGSWHVSPAPGGSLVEYRLELEMRPYPRFITNDALLARLPAVLTALDQHVK